MNYHLIYKISQNILAHKNCKLMPSFKNTIFFELSYINLFISNYRNKKKKQMKKSNIKCNKQKPIKYQYLFNNYNKTTYDIRNDYRGVFEWATTMITRCEQKNTQASDSDWNQQLILLNQEALIIQSILFQISERIKRECNQKGQIFTTIFDYTVRTINKLKRLYEINLCENSKKNLVDQQVIERKHQQINAKLKAQNQQLIKQKMHKWKNMYMIIKDNRVLRRQKGKLSRKHKQQIWRAKILQQQLVYYKKQYEKFRILFDSLYDEENYPNFVKNQIKLNSLEKKIKQYPYKANRILKKQLLDLQIKQLNGFDKKIQMILKIMEENDEFYNDYDDWEENIQPVKLYYNIFTQTQQQYEDQGTNTISEPKKVYQSTKIQTKTIQLFSNLGISRQVELQIRETLKKRSQKFQKKVKLNPMRMNQTYSPSKFSRKRSSFEPSKLITSFEERKKQCFCQNQVISLTIHPVSTNLQKAQKIKARKSKKNITKHKNIKPFQQIIEEKEEIFSRGQSRDHRRKQLLQEHKILDLMIKPIKSELKIHKQSIRYIQEPQLPANPTEQKLEKIFKPKQQYVPLKNLQNNPIKFHKRQKTEASIQPRQKIAHPFINKNSYRKSQANLNELKNIKIRKNTTERPHKLSKMNHTFNAETKKLLNQIKNTEQNGKKFQTVDEEIIQNKFVLNLMGKLLKNLCTRKQQLLVTKTTFNAYLLTFFSGLYGKSDKKLAYLQKFRDGVICYGNKKDQSKIEQIMVMKKFIMSKRSLSYQSDIFRIFMTMIEMAQKMGYTITSNSYSQISIDYGKKIIEYVCSFYFTSEQTQNFIKKYKLTSQKSVNLWNFFYCLQQELNYIIFYSQLYNFFNLFIPNEDDLLDSQKIDEITYILELKNINQHKNRHKLRKFAKNGMPIHRIILFAYRFNCYNFLNIQTFIEKSISSYFLGFSTNNVEQIMKQVQECFKNHYRFKQIKQLYLKWRLQYILVSGNKNLIFLKFCWVMLRLLELQKSVQIGECLSIFQQNYRKILKSDKMDDYPDLL